MNGCVRCRFLSRKKLKLKGYEHESSSEKSWHGCVAVVPIENKLRLKGCNQ